MRSRSAPWWKAAGYSQAVACAAMKETTDIAFTIDKPRWHYIGPRDTFDNRQWVEWLLVEFANAEEAGTLR